MATKSNRGAPAKHGSGGGGLNTRQHVKTPVRTGKPANGVNPGAVSYLGTKVGNHSTDTGDFTFKATPWKGTPPVSNNIPLGNQTSLAGAGAGARPGGAGRKIHPTSSQGQHGPANPGAQSGSPFLPGGSGGPGSMGFKGPGK